MKVLFVTPSFYPAAYYGGSTTFSYALCNSLAKIQVVGLRVLTTDADGPSKRIPPGSIRETLDAGYEVYYCRRFLPPDISPGLLLRLPKMIRQSDIVHLAAVYSFTTLPTLMLCRLMRKPVVWSTMGALQRWQGTTRNRIKRLWERACDTFCEPGRVVLHVTSEEERTESLRKLSNVRPAVIRIGIDLPKLNSIKNPDPDSALQLLYMGRLHPIKGIENLLQALVPVKDSVRLSICGEGEPEYERRLRALVSELGLEKYVEFQGSVEGAAKEQQFLKADLCVVPSFKESFGMVVAESLARGVPVIASRGTPWQRVEDIGCGLWVENEAEELSRAIRLATNLPLQGMGLRGRDWMGLEYSWASIAEEMAEQYRSLIEVNHSKRRGEARAPQAA